MSKEPTYKELEQRVKKLKKLEEERKRTEEELRESENRYRCLVEGSPDIIYSFSDKRGGFYVSPRVESVLGYSPAYLSENPFVWYDSIHPEDLEKVDQVIKEFSEGKSFDIEYRIKDADGNWHWFRDRSIGESKTEEEVIIEGLATDITDQKRAEEALRESEERYRSLFKNNHSVMLIIDPENADIVDANSAAISYYGWSYEELTCKKITNINTLPEEQVFHEMEQAKKEHCRHFYFQHRLANGDISDVEVYSGPIQLQGRQLLYSIIHDITERKKTEEALQESEEKFKHLTEELSDVVLTLTLDGNLSYVSPAVKDFGGYDPEEEVENNIAKYFAKENELIAALNLIEEISIHKKSASIEFLFKPKNKEPFYVEVTGKPLIKQNRVVSIQCVMRDISKRKQAEDELRESEERFRNVYDTAPLAFVVWDKNTSVTDWNKKAEALFGWSKEEVIGNNFFDFLIPEKDRPQVTDVVNTLIKGELQSHSINDNLTKDGKIISCEWNNSVLHDNGGNIIGAISLGLDITERKQMEEEKDKLQTQLQQAQRMEDVGTIAGGVAHDLNNVLSGIVSYPELILMDLPQDSPLIKPVLTMRDSGKKAAAIVQDLLTLTRRGVVTKEIVNLKDIITEHLKSPEHEKLRFYHPGVEIETNIESDFLNISGSFVHLSKTVMNLVSNAAEAMPDGGKVLIFAENRYIDRPISGYDSIEEGDYITLSVSDTGIGISSQEMERIFEPFYTKKVMGRSGTGLGMTVVRGTVKDHNGYIDVQSTEGKGSTFTLYFPATHREIDKEKALLPTEEYTGQGESILVVDDIKEQREIASAMLTTLGYSVHTVSSGEEAVEYLKEHSVDLIVLDMIMEPGIDGLDTYEQILELHPRQKAIIASGFSETDRVKEVLRLGAGSYIKKPYTLEKIGLAVKAELEK